MHGLVETARKTACVYLHFTTEHPPQDDFGPLGGGSAVREATGVGASLSQRRQLAMRFGCDLS